MYRLHHIIRTYTTYTAHAMPTAHRQRFLPDDDNDDRRGSRQEGEAVNNGDDKEEADGSEDENDDVGGEDELEVEELVPFVLRCLKRSLKHPRHPSTIQASPPSTDLSSKAT